MREKRSKINGTNKIVKRIKLHWHPIIRDKGWVVQSPIKPTQDLREF